MSDILTRTSARQIITLARDIARTDDNGYSVTRALAALYGKHWPDFPLEHVPAWDHSVECDEHERLKRQHDALGQYVAQGDLLVPSGVLRRPVHTRDLSTTSGKLGGYAVGSDMPFHDDLLRAQSVAFQMGVQLVGASHANFAWPKQITASTPAWLTPGGAATSSAPTFVQVSSTPHTLLAFVEVPYSLLTQAGPAGEQFILDGLRRDLLTGVDQAVLVGPGAGQPLGICTTPGIGSVVGTTIDYAKVVEFQTDVSDNNAVVNPATTGYVTTPTVAALLKGRQRFTGTDSPLWKGSIAFGEIEGCRAMSSKQMNASTLLFGDWSTVYVVEWGALTLRINPFQDFNRGYVGIRAMWMVDVVVRYPLAFSLATSIT